MALEAWTEQVSHWMATGDVDSSGKMTGAEITNTTGSTVDRDRTFDSKADFEAYARQAAGVR